MIELKDISLGYGDKLLINHADAVIPSGEVTALIGRNGAGKSTLLRAVAGLNHSYSGTIEIDGNNINDLDSTEMARLLSIVTSTRTRVRNLRCRDLVAIGRAPYTDWTGRLQTADHEAVQDALATVGMEEFSSRKSDTLSDGEFQRIMIARAIAQDTPVMLLDEPTSSLDLPSRYELCDLLACLAHEKSKTVLFSTHELDIAVKRCDNIALIADRTIHMFKAADLEGIEVAEIFAPGRWNA